MAMATKNYNSQYVAYMEANARVNQRYRRVRGGIEVVKAFNQSTDSYEKFVREITSFKDFTLAWLQGHVGSHKPEHVDRPHDPSRGFARRHRPLPFRIAHGRGVRAVRRFCPWG